MDLVSNKEKKIISVLLKWYGKNKRILPWRGLYKNNLPNPYYIMISEFMLQQTTVRTVVPKFNEFIKIWPNLRSLNSTTEARILKIWSGLGYYTRARNLLKSIKIISKKYNYIIPNEYDDLISLPGIGNYTAKAILGIAFNKPVMPIDVNIERIIKRIYGLSESTSNIKKKIIDCSIKLISKKKSSYFIQALMDYGSATCLLNKPKCDECIISSHCEAFKNNLTYLTPLKNKKVVEKPKKITRAYIIINEYKEVLVRRRPHSGMLQSMLEVPNDKWATNKKLLNKDRVTKLFSRKFSKINEELNYSFSHLDLIVEIYFASVKKIKIVNHFWISLGKIAHSGMPTIMKKIMKIYQNSLKH